MSGKEEEWKEVDVAGREREREEQLPIHDYIPVEWVQRSGDAQAYPANS